MKNKFSGFFIILLLSSNAFADNSSFGIRRSVERLDSASRYGNRDNQGSSVRPGLRGSHTALDYTHGPDRRSCTSVPLDSLNFVGTRFPTEGSICVAAYNDSEANAACGSGYWAINPGNHQYRPFVIGGGRDHNDLGFYYCVPGRTSPSKQTRCITLAPQIEEHRRRNIAFRWQADPGRSDGDCQCGVRGADGQDPASWEDCNQMGTILGRIPELEPLPPMHDLVEEIPRVQPLNIPVSEELRRCVAEYTGFANDCQRAVDALDSACRSQDGAGVQNGSGTQDSCYNMAVAGFSARSRTQRTNDSCQANVESCSNTCSANKYEEFRRTCAQLVGMTPEALAASTSSDGRYFAEHAPTLQQRFSAGAQSCQAGRQSQTSLFDRVASLGRTIQSSLSCSCMASGSPDRDCSTIPEPSACEPGADASVASAVNSVGCDVYHGLNACAPGAGYNASICNCQLNPRAEGCPSGRGSGSLSSFAGTQIKVAAAVAAGFSPSIVENTGGAPLDLSTPADVASTVVAESSESGSSALVEAAVSVAAGGAAKSGGAGTAPEESLAADVAKKSGGMFSKLKNMANKLLNGEKSSGNGLLASDRKGFVPRGIASARKRSIGAKNMDIWKMMNMCVQGETCVGNQGNYIGAP